MLELEDSLPQTTSAQKEANKVRREYYMHLQKERPEPSPTINSNFAIDLLMKRLENQDYRMSVRMLLDE